MDKYVLDQALDYGFLSDSAFKVLFHIYEMRCIYGHPYEESPSEEQVSHAAAAVVENILSRPVKLRHGFGQKLLKSLLEDPSYQDDHRTAVDEFAKDVLPRLDEKIHGWLLEKVWDGLEQIADDSTMKVFWRRGLWFTQTLIREVGIEVFYQRSMA